MWSEFRSLLEWIADSPSAVQMSEIVYATPELIIRNTRSIEISFCRVLSSIRNESDSSGIIFAFGRPQASTLYIISKDLFSLL